MVFGALATGAAGLLGRNSPEQEAITNIINTSVAKTIQNNTQQCQTSIDTSQLQSLTCTASDALAEIIRNSRACVNCQAQNSTNPNACNSFCFACVFSGNAQTIVVHYTDNCQLTSQQTTDIKSAAVNDIKQNNNNKQDAVGAIVQGILGSTPDQTTKTNLTNNLSTTLTQDTIQAAINKVVLNQQQIAYGNSLAFTGNSQDINAQIMISSLASNNSYSTAVNNLSNYVKQQNDNEVTLFGDLLIWIIIAVIVVIVLVIIYRAYRNSRDRREQREQENRMMMMNAGRR